MRFPKLSFLLLAMQLLPFNANESSFLSQLCTPFCTSLLSADEETSFFYDDEEDSYEDDEEAEDSWGSQVPNKRVSKKRVPKKQACSLSQTGAISVRHIEGKGIGYGEGYTTLDGFFAFPGSTLKHDYVPFLDLRGHVFDNGKFAANAGLGVRLIRSHIHTIGAYYDYRSTKHYHYNQVSLNYENLGKKFDWRVNGYLPVGDKYSSTYQPKFAYFQGNSLIISEKREFAMWGVNAEIGKRFYQKHHFDCYGAIGPYYFGRSSTNAWGGQARIGAIYKKYIQIDVNGSYDNVFNWIGQGQLSLVFPLGPKNKKNDKKWCKGTSLRARASERVERNEIIVVDHKREKNVAIDPLTGLPYTIWFVNNTSNSLGTYESPFPTLVQAQTASNPNDLIYVFPGDRTNTGMNAGITLQNNQQLLGSSTPHPLNTTRGTVTIPALTKGLPYITNNVIDSGAVNLASNNVVSGLLLEGLGPSFGITGGPPFVVDMTNVTIGDCVVIGDASQAIYLQGNANLGDVTITNSTLTSLSQGLGFESNTKIGAVSISNCSINGGSYGIDFENTSNVDSFSMINTSLSGGAFGLFFNLDNAGSISIINCPVSAGSFGLYFNVSTMGTTTISNSPVSAGTFGLYFSINTIGTTTISNCPVSAGNDAILVQSNSNVGTIFIGNCPITSTSGAGINFDSNSLSTAIISNCIISAPGGNYGMTFTNNPTSPTSTFFLSLQGNTITNPPPVVSGYNIVNPVANPPSAFLLQLQGNTGSANIQNVTLVP